MSIRYVRDVDSALRASFATTLRKPRSSYGEMTPRATAPNDGISLVAEQNFIRATRDAGYRSTTAAVAELVDNAIQANAQSVHVFVREELGPDGRELSLAVLDDGDGMAPAALRQALQFGGSSRFGDRSGIGRYGMGLPNSSVSQARRLEVISWQARDSVWRCYLDVDEVAASGSEGIPIASPACVPDWVASQSANHGTLVIWSKCDRFDVKKGTTLASKLRTSLGRLYRRKLWDGWSILVNNVPASPNDPLFSHPVTAEGGATPFEQPLRYSITLPKTDRETIVTVRFVELPVARWHDLSTAEKKSRQIVGGAGVSILRAGREIDFGWHLMGSKRRENYDDWWRCEVSFEPEADELFGVTHTKQGVKPSAYLRAILTPDLESIARTLNARARAAFERVRSSSESRAALAATSKDSFLPPISLPSTARVMSDHFSYRVRLSPVSSNALFTTARRGNVITVRLNNEHPFVERVYSSNAPGSERQKREAIERLVIAAARARLSCDSDAARLAIDRYLGDWSDVLAAFSER